MSTGYNRKKRDSALVPDRFPPYSYRIVFEGVGNGRWEIYKSDGLGIGPAIWTFPYLPEHDDLGEPPVEVRAEYERLNGLDGSVRVDPGQVTFTPNVVEMIADAAGFDQACAFGCRVDDHAVYCHNERWLYAPRKCRRTWYTGGKVRDEDCLGFFANPRVTSAPPSPTPSPRTHTEPSRTD